jgi:hypothetical protein
MPCRKHSEPPIAIPRYMFQGTGFSARSDTGLPPQKAKYGSLIPTERKVPTAATSRRMASMP